MELIPGLPVKCLFVVINWVWFNGVEGGSRLIALDKSTLQFVSVISRHGHRSPLFTYPNDIYQVHDNNYWPDGPGQLTKIGEAQAYRVGLNLRSRYDGFISSFYDRNETYFSSNLNDRDLMSAQLVAAGFYPPRGRQIWNSSLSWQPVPIWPEPRDADDVISGGLCPKFDRLREKVYELEFGQLSSSDEEFVKRLEHLTGGRFEKGKGLKMVYDALIIEKENGFDLPDWADNNLLKRLEKMATKQYNINVAGFPGMAELSVGRIFADITKTMKEKYSRTLAPDRKMQVMLSHDTFITAILGILGITDFISPKMASYLVFELHYVQTHGPIVQALYFNDSSTLEPVLLDLPVCQHPCLLYSLIEYVNRVVPSDWEKECSLPSASFVLPGVWIIFIILVVLIHYA